MIDQNRDGYVDRDDLQDIMISLGKATFVTTLFKSFCEGRKQTCLFRQAISPYTWYNLPVWNISLFTKHWHLIGFIVIAPDGSKDGQKDIRSDSPEQFPSTFARWYTVRRYSCNYLWGRSVFFCTYVNCTCCRCCHKITFIIYVYWKTHSLKIFFFSYFSVISGQILIR